MSSLFNNGILLVHQLINKDGKLLSLPDFLHTPKDYALQFYTIPRGHIFKNCNLIEMNINRMNQNFIGDELRMQ